MHLLDGVIVVFALIAALRGWRVGATSQLLGAIGFLAGLAIGAALVLVLEPHINGTTSKLVVAVVLLIVPPVLVADGARRLGRSLWHALRKVRLGTIDAAAGAVIGATRTVLVFWLLASVFINSSLPSVSSTIDNSVIIAKVQQVMPPLPDELATVERYLSTSGFPQVLANVVPESVAPVTVAGSPELRSAVASAGPSTVRVLGEGCGDIKEGTGFVVANGLVVTNAHVVAGINTLSVTAPNEPPISATIISFDPDLDLAVLRPESALASPPLTVDPGFVTRGVTASVLGYPEDGPFDAQPAGIIARFDAQGRNIYDTGLTNRTVYELQANIRPGNSGGPLVAANGEVIGVVFSRSTTQASVGYALASPAVLSEIQRASPNQPPVGSGACVS